MLKAFVVYLVIRAALASTNGSSARLYDKQRCLCTFGIKRDEGVSRTSKMNCCWSVCSQPAEEPSSFWLFLPFKCEQKVKLLFHLQSSLKLLLPLSFNFTIEFIHSADLSIIELGD